MKFHVRRGRNQRGLSFVRVLPKEFSNKIVQVTLGKVDVITELKENEKVPDDIIILDSRLYDELGCNETSLVSVEPIKENITSSVLLEQIKLFSAFMDTTDLDKIQSRLDNLERSVKGTKSHSIGIPNTGQLEPRFKEVLEHLESLSSRLKELEKRINSLSETLEANA
ncbi:MAG: hypothetical protein ACTSUO_08770 [Candidatus Thorarchaeota archaeon]